MKDKRHAATEELLVSYLDGELPSDETQRFETRLKADAELRRRLHQHQQAWDLLDSLPKTDVDEDFTRSTVGMIAQSASKEIDSQTQATQRAGRLTWWIVAEVLVVAALLGFIFVRLVVTAPNRQLVKDLGVIENLDAYRHAQDIEFLRALEREGLFSVERADEL